jgi:tetratricopeptide (TPR) repeat protein
MQPPSVSADCYDLPEIVDVGVAEMAAEKDLRAAVTETRRVASLLHGQDPARGPATPQGPAWPVEAGSLTEAVYWYRRFAGQGNHTSPEEVMAALSNLGYSWREQRRWVEAETALRESLQLRQQYGDRRGMGYTYFDLGTLYEAQERWTDAEQVLSRSLEIAREIGDRRGEAYALDHLGNAYAHLGQAEKAIGLLEQALQIGQEIKAPSLVRVASTALTRLGRPPAQ